MKTIKIVSLFFVVGFILVGFIQYEKQDNPLPNLSEPEIIKWHTFQEALELSKREKKKIFIDVYTNWCGWCKVMDRNTFSNQVVAKYMNDHFYAIKLNAEMNDTIFFNGNTYVNPNPNTPRSTHQLASALLNNQLSYPTTVYLDENFSMLTQVPGYRKPEELETILNFFGGNAFKTRKWEEFSSTFKSEIIPEPSVAPQLPPPH
jgi:thioredoxin-related protein